MNARRVNAAAGVILAAQKQRNTATGIAAALEAAVLLQSPEQAAELAAYRALELGTPEGRVSAKCEDASHPVWLRDLDDMRGCPWCRVAELEALAANGNGITYALTVIAKHGDMSDEVRQEIRDLLPAEDSCRPCGCPKRFDRHADGCPTECPSCAAPADSSGYRIPEHRTGCPQAVTA